MEKNNIPFKPGDKSKPNEAPKPQGKDLRFQTPPPPKKNK